MENKLDRLRKTHKSIKFEGISILTGSNGSGKSLIRQQLIFRLAEQLGVEYSSGLIGSVSMQLRTEQRPEFGALSSMMHDSKYTPTSLNSFSLIEKLFKKDFKYLIIDEPEIGMGEEMVMTLVNYLNTKFKELNKNVLGVLVITHNRYIVNNLMIDNFYNIEGYNKEQWLNRELVPIDLEEFKKNELYDLISELEQNA